MTGNHDHPDDRQSRTTGRLISASVVVVSYNTARHIESCLLSLLELDYSPSVEIIVVDNASTDGSVELVRERFPDVELVELPQNKGFAGGASVGLYMAGGEIVATVNPDARLDPGWMRAVAASLESPNAGIVGSKILFPDGKTIQHAGGIVHYPLATTEHRGRGEIDRGQYDHAEHVSFVTGAALAMRRDVGHALGFFDEEYYPVYYEDVDLCWRARKEGLRVLYQPAAVAYHKETVTLDRSGSEYYGYFHANRLRFVVKHYSPEQVLLDFMPAEAARVAGDMPAEDRAASLDLLDNRPAAQSGVHAHPAEKDLIAHKWEALRRDVDEVLERWHVYQQAWPREPARAQRGVLGRFRNLARRVYAWPVLRKQIDYNASIARTLREISAQLADLQARVSVQALLVSGLASRQTKAVEDIYAELDTLRGRLDRLDSEKMRDAVALGRQPHA